MEEHLRRIVRNSGSWGECRHRVEQSYGADFLKEALGIARTQRPEWFQTDDELDHIYGGAKRTEPQHFRVESFPPITITSSPRLAPGRWDPDAILVTAIAALVLVVLFPPFVTRAEGFIFNLGHAFLLGPPARGQLVGVVDVHLLLCEVLVVVLVTVLALLVGRLGKKAIV